MPLHEFGAFQEAHRCTSMYGAAHTHTHTHPHTHTHTHTHPHTHTHTHQVYCKRDNKPREIDTHEAHTGSPERKFGVGQDIDDQDGWADESLDEEVANILKKLQTF